MWLVRIKSQTSCEFQEDKIKTWFLTQDLIQLKEARVNSMGTIGQQLKYLFKYSDDGDDDKMLDQKESIFNSHFAEL